MSYIQSIWQSWSASRCKEPKRKKSSPIVPGLSAVAAAAAAVIEAGRLGKDARFWNTCKILLSGSEGLA